MLPMSNLSTSLVHFLKFYFNPLFRLEELVLWMDRVDITLLDIKKEVSTAQEYEKIKDNFYVSNFCHSL